MNLIDMLNSATGGVVLGIVITKTFDILNKKVEYTLEAKKIRYNEKLKIGEKAVNYLTTFNDELFNIRELIDQFLENTNLNQKLFERTWDISHKKVENLGNMTMDMLNSAYFYYDINDNGYDALIKELYNSISPILNMKETQDFSNSNEILKRYKNSIQKIINSNSEIKVMIITQSKK